MNSRAVNFRFKAVCLIDSIQRLITATIERYVQNVIGSHPSLNYAFHSAKQVSTFVCLISFAVFLGFTS